MTPSTAPIAADPQNSGPTGPRTAEGKARCRLNAFRHGLTSQVFVFTADEAPVYHKHHADIAKYYQPSGPIETALADQIANGIWRLQRAQSIEEGIFALDAAPDPEPGAVLTDSIPGPTRAWLDQAKAFDLLGKYERRIRRDLDRDKSELAALQSARKQQAAMDMDRAVTLHRLAKSEGKPYDPTIFQTPNLTPESVFSPEIAVPEAARPDALFRVQQRPKAA